MDAADTISCQCLWKPNSNKRTNVDIYRERVNKQFGVNLGTYKELYDWSIENYPDFWQHFWDFASVKYSQNYEQVVEKDKRMDEIPQWFKGARLNFAENILKCRDNRVAIYAAMEGREEVKKRTFSELHERVGMYAAALRNMGVQKGDRVVGYISNCMEAVEAMLATSSIGAVWSSTSPDFGVTGVLDRFSQIKPKVIFSVNAVRYNGKYHDHIGKLQGVVNGLPNLEKVVIIPLVPNSSEDILSQTKLQNVCLLDDFLKTGQTQKGTYPVLKFEPLPFNHPLFIMFSSGTTGVPKCIVHSAGGTLLKHLEEHILQGNMQKDDIMLYYTTTGWMMWNWFVSALAVGAAIVCYDGSPLVPSPNVLWDLIDKLEITVLGTGAKWLAVLEDKGVKPRETHSLKSLKSVLSTGSPLKPESFDYVYRDIKSDLVLGSITGGTDIIGCFAGNSWDVPVYRGEIQTRFLGMAMQSWTEEGNPIEGDSGELVCTQPFPSMPTCFWNDEDGAKYKKAYFNKFDGIWAHGDFCMINPQTGGTVMLGRSDGTLNPNGVRFGSAEIYHVVESFKEVQDSLCVAQRSKDGSEERVILFLKMASGHEFTEELVQSVRAHVRLQLSARHVPTLLLPTADIPYTHSGKKVEVAVKSIIAGQDVKIRGAYANPDSLDLYKNLPQLQGF